MAPNSFHYAYAKEFAARCPAANLLVAPGLLERVPELAAAEELPAVRPEAWSGDLEFSTLGPVRGLCEVVFFHLASGTLILTDLAFNMTRFARAFDRIVWRMSGLPAGFGPGRTSRLLLLRDHAEASRCLSGVSEWPIERIVVAHGEAIEINAKAEFSRAFAPYVVAPKAG